MVVRAVTLPFLFFSNQVSTPPSGPAKEEEGEVEVFYNPQEQSEGLRRVDKEAPAAGNAEDC